MKVIIETVDSSGKQISDAGITLSENQVKWLAELLSQNILNCQQQKSA